MNPTDLEIQRRLEKLRGPVPTIPSEDELSARLRALKGESSCSTAVSNKYVLFPKPQSTTEQVDNLMKKFSNEVSITEGYSKTKSIDEIEKRLQKLKSNNDRPAQQFKAVPSHESDTKILLKKILAEAELEKKTENKFPHLAPDLNKNTGVEKMDCSDTEEEFCTICDRRPKWLCLDCNNHSFCARCFNEYHEEIGEYHRKKLITLLRRPSFSDSDEYSD